MKIFVAGAGKLANAILDADLTFPSCEVMRWNERCSVSPEKGLVVHAGSGRQLEDIVNYCSSTKSVLIELSTGLSTEHLKADFPLVLCPNTSILVLKTLQMIKAYGDSFSNFELSLLESHQSAKKTEPGTAYAIADSLKLPHEKILSVRNPDIQAQQLHIPLEFLDKHAYHRLVIKDGDDEVTIETKVLGHASYASGVKKMIDCLLTHQLDNGTYTIFDLIDRNLL